MLRHVLLPFQYVFYFFQHINYKYKSFKELMFIFSNGLIFLFFVLIQFNIIRLSQPMYIPTKEINNFFLGLFQVHATISTLGIAVISIISGVINSKYFGIQVTDYILNLRPRILKHRIAVSTCSIYLLLYYLFLSLGIYNLCSAIFISSVLVCLRMFSEIYAAFSRVSTFQDEIKKYLVESCEEKSAHSQFTKFFNILHHLQDEIRRTTSVDDFASTRDAVLLFDELVSNHVSKLSKISPETYLEKIQSNYWDFYLIIVDLGNQKNDAYLELYMSSITNIFNLCSRYRININLWNEISAKFFSRVSTINQNVLQYSSEIRDLRISLFENLTNHENTWFETINFLPALYNSLKANSVFSTLSASAKQRFWMNFVFEDTLKKTEYSIMTDTRSLQRPRKEELNKFYKVLIHNNDFDVFYSVFPVTYCEYVDLNLSIMIYLYEIMHSKHNFESFLTIHLSSLAERNDPLCMHSACLDKDILFDRINKAAHYLKKYWNIAYEANDLSEFDIEERAEFLFYYILFQSTYLDANDIIEVINHYFKSDIRKIRYFCCYKQYDKFEQKYKSFLRFLLGKSNVDYEENTTHAFNICKKLAE